MNLPIVPIPTIATPELNRSPNTHLYGRWLVIARIGWIVLVTLTLGIFVATIPVYTGLLQTMCSGTTCVSGQPAPDTVQALHTLGISTNLYAVFTIVLTLAAELGACAVAGVLAWRKSDDWMALLVALMLIMMGTATTVYTLELSHTVWHVPALVLNILTFGTLFLVCSLIPDGQFVPRWTRWLAPGWIIWGAVFIFVPESSFSELLNNLVWLGALTILIAALLYRYRHMSSPIQRQQVKWIVFGGSVAILVAIVFNLPPLIFPPLSRPGSIYDLTLTFVNSIDLYLVPLSIGVAILRYRLWEVDILINRTLVYSLLTGTLALVYAGLILSLQYLLSGITGGSQLAIVGSTLAIAALFQPLRRRIQQVIDRRFYRRKYDAAKTLEAFSATLRSEVDLNQLREQLIAVVEETMQPAHISLWLRQPEHKTHENLKHKEPV
jgi:hypothetical protein